jgi:hypothetical protein
MMCIACEQDAMWFAYLKRKGLITPDGYLVEPPPSVFMAEPSEPAPQDEKKDGVCENADQGALPFDDPAKG